jgi:hypothetical protein
MAMLPVKIQNAAIVVLSASNNPRLLNGDFLKRHQIVPEEWVVTDTLVTPPVAQVTFENGLQVLVEENRLHFQANRPEDFPWAEELRGPLLPIWFADYHGTDSEHTGCGYFKTHRRLEEGRRNGIYPHPTSGFTGNHA